MVINLIEYFENTVKRNKSKTAVVDNERRISFADLRSKALGLSGVLSYKINGCTNLPIAVYLPKSIESVYSDIAINYSGNIYMNLDVRSPLARISNIIIQTSPGLIITASEYAEKLREITDVPLVLLGDVPECTDTEAAYAAAKTKLDQLIDTDPLCIINTSGSTGTPKGVVLNHKSFIDFIEWANETLKISDNEIVGSLSPIIFDIYSYELCMLYNKGATLVIIQESLSAFPASILQLLEKEKVNFIFWVPTIMVNIANMKLLERFKLSLKKIWFAGEVFPTKQFNYWHRTLPGAMFVNLYGPIEITLDCTYYIVDREFDDNEPLPIGKACRNTDILILNENNKKCAVNEEGELCVRGTSLAMGYYNNKEKTDVAFVQNPLNAHYPEIIYRTGDIALMNNSGEIIFKGRKDSLVKHLGYRIELAEIEHVIVNSLKLFSNCCIAYDQAKKEIVLFYESDADADIAKVRKQIAEALPKYMVPTRYLRYELLPRNANGKIDRLLLKNSL